MADDVNVKMSMAQKGRKTINYLQEQKDNGVKLVQMCPAQRDPFWTLAAEMAGCDICRLTTPRVHHYPTKHNADRGEWWIHYTRELCKYIHLNYVMETHEFANKFTALETGSIYHSAGADSLLPMGINNETLKFLADNYIVVFGHVGALSGWQTSITTYKRIKTAEECLKVAKMAYEYQENGMGAMTIELTPNEVSEAIAKKLRIPVISICGAAACDGSEMVDMDTFGVSPSPASHVKTYGNYWEWACGIYGQWANDVRTGAYPEEKHCWHMEASELEKFQKGFESI